ncbi:unnamed protein product [Moneuplotes crassus]|uniref:Uncharacterized protein n=1 Tax=Euplotes crassus TaxID=5936 RepID=A0AAD1U3H4_EUPCR|nr:unnamed protein product [Moneuplotes crassus]
MKRLLPAKSYLYFTLKVKLGSEESFKAMIQFMDLMGEVTLRYQFDQVHIKMEEFTKGICNLFLQKYIEKGFNKKAIVFNYDRLLYEMTTAFDIKMRYIHFDSSEVKENFYSENFASKKFLAGCEEIEKCYVHSLNYPLELLNMNFNWISINPKVLSESSVELMEYKFRNENCKTLEFHHQEYLRGRIGRRPHELSNEEFSSLFSDLDEFSSNLPNLENFYTKYVKCFKYIVSQQFFQENENYQNLSKIKNFTFESEIDYDRVCLDFKCPKAEIIYQNSEDSHVSAFTISDIELKLMPDEFCYDSEHQILVLEKAPSALKFKNIRICKDEMKIAELADKIEGKVYLNVVINSPLLKPEGDLSAYGYHLNGHLKKTPLVTYKNIISESRPHYIFNAFVEPDKSDALGISKVCKLHLSNIIRSVSNLPTNGVVSIYIHAYFVFVDYWSSTYTISDQAETIRNRKGKIAKEITRIDANEDLCTLIDKLKGINLYEFRCESIIDNDAVVQKFCELCRTNPSIRDIELNLEHANHGMQILESLKYNYIIKTVRLMTQEAIKVPSQSIKSSKPKKSKKKNKVAQKPESAESIQLYSEIISYCDDFRRKRLGTEIMLNTNHKKYKPCERKGFNLSYR